MGFVNQDSYGAGRLVDAFEEMDRRRHRSNSIRDGIRSGGGSGVGIGSGSAGQTSTQQQSATRSAGPGTTSPLTPPTAAAVQRMRKASLLSSSPSSSASSPSLSSLTSVATGTAGALDDGRSFLSTSPLPRTPNDRRNNAGGKEAAVTTAAGGAGTPKVLQDTLSSLRRLIGLWLFYHDTVESSSMSKVISVFFNRFMWTFTRLSSACGKRVGTFLMSSVCRCLNCCMMLRSLSLLCFVMRSEEYIQDANLLLLQILAAFLMKPVQNCFMIMRSSFAIIATCPPCTTSCPSLGRGRHLCVTQTNVLESQICILTCPGSSAVRSAIPSLLECSIGVLSCPVERFAPRARAVAMQDDLTFVHPILLPVVLLLTVAYMRCPASIAVGAGLTASLEGC